MSKKTDSQSLYIDQPTVIRKYGVNKKIIDRYFPKPIVKQYRSRKGHYIYSRYWDENEVARIVRLPEVAALIEESASSRQINLDMNEARSLLLNFTPDRFIERAKELKRVFVLHAGPTNSGKTYDAVEALKSSGNGTYLGPLRLLAMEMCDKINAAGIPCSLLTGEESIPKEGAQIVSSTVELCDFQKHFKVAVIDEAQLIADNDRGSAWFRAICLVDAEEVHICLAPEALDYIESLVSQFGDPYSVVRHERFVPLVYSGRCHGYRDIHPADAIICFSRKNVLSTAALLEQNGFKASVIYGALPPAARRNEVARYMSGETNIIVATDAIGLGISLPIRRIIFAETQKFDGKQQRRLYPGEIRQIAGRAGRYGMFDMGEVLTMDSTDTVSSGLKNAPAQVRLPCIGFPREVLSTAVPLDILMKAWQSLPPNRSFKREDMSDAIKLNSILRNRVIGKDRELVYSLVTCPIDSDNHDLVLYWLRCAGSILRGRPIPDPDFDTDTLLGCELQYKAWDVNHQLKMRIGIIDDSTEERDAICRKIRELMEANKSEYILKCRICGKELSFGYSFNVCSKCYSSRSFSYSFPVPEHTGQAVEKNSSKDKKNTHK